MQAELVVIEVALTKFEEYHGVGIFTDSLSNLHAIHFFHDHQGLSGPLLYRHYSLLSKSITDLLDTHRERGFSTTLRKVRGHTHIRGNDLVDAVTNLAVRDFDNLPPTRTLRIEVSSIVACPLFWVMFTSKNPKLPSFISQRSTTGHTSPPTVDDTGGRPPPNACLHASLSPDQTQSPGGHPTGAIPHLTLQENHPPRQGQRGAHQSHGRDYQ